MTPDRTMRLDLRQLKDKIGTAQDVYMRRRQFFAIRLFGTIYQLRLHTIFRRDRDANPHTHPFRFFSLILRNGYTEQLYDNAGVETDLCVRRRFHLGYREKRCVHNIVELTDNKPVTTLVLAMYDVADKDYGDWGFIENGQYVSEKIYLNREEQRGRRVEKETEERIAA